MIPLVVQTQTTWVGIPCGMVELVASPYEVLHSVGNFLRQLLLLFTPWNVILLSNRFFIINLYLFAFQQHFNDNLHL